MTSMESGRNCYIIGESMFFFINLNILFSHFTFSITLNIVSSRQICAKTNNITQITKNADSEFSWNSGMNLKCTTTIIVSYVTGFFYCKVIKKGSKLGFLKIKMSV